MVNWILRTGLGTRWGLAAAIAMLAAFPPAAIADSIVYEKDGNIWQAAPDGSNQRQVTTAGGYSKPTQADDGTIVAVKDNLLHRMDRGGRVLNTAGEAGGTGPITPQLSPGGQHAAYNYYFNGGFSTALSHSTRQTAHEEIFYISGRTNPSWIGNGSVVMFDGSSGFNGDTLIYTLGGSGTQTWYEDPELVLSGGEINASATRFAATNGTVIRLYTLSGPPPAGTPSPACDFVGPAGSFFRPTWSPDGGRLAWQEDNGIWVASFCQNDGRVVIPGGKAPDWGPANVSTPAAAGGGGGGVAGAPTLTAKIAKRLRRRVVLRGFTVKVRCSAACSITADLLNKRKRIARARKKLSRAGTAKLKLRPSARARRRLTRKWPRKLTLRIRAKGASGKSARTITRRITIRR